jgi:cytochrome d ubiquinol oxidase subunit I
VQAKVYFYRTPKRGAAMNASVSDPAFWSRVQFGFTLIYHYLFPQLTMGLAWFLVYWKWRALTTGEEKYNRAVRFWAKIFGLNFAIGVVTGIPMEFQFGTNWAGFSRYAGGTIGQTLAMEGMFALFLESAFVGALLWGEKRLGARYHFLAAVAVALGSWLSGYFILVTNAFMQHPVGYLVDARGYLGIGSFRAYLLNPWALIEFSHNQIAALVTGSFVVTAIGAFYRLRQLHPTQAQLYLSAGTCTGLIASLLVAFPTGDQQAKMVGRHQPVTLAAMEGRTLARSIRIQYLAAVGFDAGASLPLHCQHGWMDDGRTGASTLANLWPFSHQRRL